MPHKVCRGSIIGVVATSVRLGMKEHQTDAGADTVRNQPNRDFRIDFHQLPVLAVPDPRGKGLAEHLAFKVGGI